MMILAPRWRPVRVFWGPELDFVLKISARREREMRGNDL
jgi:hypothetical protein